jgi:hypothetical protein
VLLDSTPLVGPDFIYCRDIGFTDGRTICPVRPEGHPERQDCEAWRVGTAADTGLVGPTWTMDGMPCTTEQETGCANNPNNPYQLLVYASGNHLVTACTANSACGELLVQR